jgi:AAA domain-containing protein/bifunctional DNA primase/polymerase-like protein
MSTLHEHAQWLHDLGANVNAIQRGTKKPLNRWEELKSRRQTANELASYPWQRAAGVGIMNGPGGWHTYDIDAPKDAQHKPTRIVGDDAIDSLLDALRLPRDYPWVWRGGSGAGWGLAFHCDDPLPPGTLPAAKEAGVAWGWPGKDSGADWHHLELRYHACQTIYPPSERYQWRHDAPTDAPAMVPLHRVISAFFALCPPPPHTLGSIDAATKEAIRQRFDLVDYAVKAFGGDTQAEGREIRVLGHGGMLINPDKQVWNCFSDEVGGDCFELVAYAKYRTVAKNLNGKGAEILQAAAEFAGVVIPDRVPVPTSDQRVISPVIAPRFAVAHESALMDLPPIRYLDRDLGLVAGAFHLIYGASGSGKTFYAIERAMRQVALGRRVLYIATEDVQGLRYRVVAWRHAHPEASGALTWLQMPEGLDLQDYDQVAELIEAVEPYAYDHIILDTLREAHSGDENSSQDTRRINRAIQRLVVTGAALDVVHHTGVNGERPRGSTALFGNADAVIKVEDDDGAIRVNFDKLRNAPPRDSLLFGMVQQDTGLTDTDGEPVVSVVLRPAGQFTRRDAKLTPTQRKVLTTLALSIFDGIGAKAQQVIDTAEITRRHTYLALAALKTRGFVSQGDKGDPYTITTAGRAQLGAEYLQRPSDHPDSALMQASDPAFVAAAPASDLTNTAPVCASDPSDQQVISSDQTPAECGVIHSDHTRRVITGSHSDHMRSHTQTDADWVEELPADLPTVADVYANLKRLKAGRDAPHVLTPDEVDAVLHTDSTDTTFSTFADVGDELFE